MLSIANCYRNANQSYTEVITSHLSEWPSSKNLQMLDKVWRKGNPPILLLGMSTGTATTENGMEVPWTTKSRATIWSSNPIPGHTSGQSYDSPPIALFVVMLPKAHLISHSRNSGSRLSVHTIVVIWIIKIFFCTVLLHILVTSS